MSRFITHWVAGSQSAHHGGDVMSQHATAERASSISGADSAQTWSPRSRFRDPRLAGGAVLAVLAVISTWLVVSGADATVPVSVAMVDLQPGMVIRDSDVRIEMARLDAGHPYLSTPAVGATVIRPVMAGEFVPAAALGDAPLGVRAVSVPIDLGHMPADVARGSRVDVWLTGEGSGSARLLMEGATVYDVFGSLQEDGSASVVLSVPAAEVPRLVSGIRSGRVDLAAHDAGTGMTL